MIATIQTPESLIEYQPCIPLADSEELASEKTRLVLYHGGSIGQINGKIYGENTKIFVAPKGEMVAGWVIGINAREI